jgi:hypothetical protein
MLSDMQVNRLFNVGALWFERPKAGYFLEPLDAWYAVAGAAAFAPLSFLGFFFSRLLFCSLLIFRFSQNQKSDKPS